MAKRTGDRVIHSYDIGRREVLCGFPEQASSTKHAANVTCITCREMLDRAPQPQPAAHGRAGVLAERGE